MNKTSPKNVSFKETRNLWKWKKTKSNVLECECGKKYIKTRNEQTTCLFCILAKSD